MNCENNSCNSNNSMLVLSSPPRKTGGDSVSQGSVDNKVDKKFKKVVDTARRS